MGRKKPKTLNPYFEPKPTANPRPDVDKYPPRLKPESNLKDLSTEDYKQAWVTWNTEHPNQPNSFDEFQKIYGEKYEDGVKLKPASKGKKSTLSTSPDKTVKGRWQRETVLNYIFGGEVTDIGKEAQAELTRTGKSTTAHHLRGLAEDGPWVDHIIRLLEAPEGSKSYEKGMQLLETSKDYMESRGLTGQAGTTKSNLSMLEGKDPITGKTGDSAHMQVHDKMDKANLTAGKASSMDPAARMDHPEDIDLAKKDRRRIPTTQGVKVGDPYTPRMGTQAAIRQLPSDRIDAFRYTSDEIVGGRARKSRYKPRPRENLVSFFSSWADHIEQSQGIRADIDKTARVNNPGQGRALYTEALGKLNKAIGKVRSGDLIAQMSMGATTGNIPQMTVAGTALAAQSAPVQKRVAKMALQVAKEPKVQAAIAKMIKARAEKTALKTVSTYLAPGADVVLSFLEAKGYVLQGKLDQAGIAALSGVVGWAGPPGDLLSAILDGSNTALDIARLDLQSIGSSELDAEGKPNKRRKGMTKQDVNNRVWKQVFSK